MGTLPGTPADLERLMGTYGDGILRLCAMYLGDAALAEDAAQETMLRAWQHYGGFRREAGEKTWVTAIALNVCRSLLRAPWRTRRAGSELLETLSVEDAPRDDTALEAVLSLPAKYRAVVLLHYYQELSVKEIARALKLPEGTVTTRLARARDRLKRALKEWYYDA